MSESFNTTVANWQGVDDVPTAGSHNLVESGGVEERLFNIYGKFETERSFNAFIYVTEFKNVIKAGSIVKNNGVGEIILRINGTSSTNIVSIAAGAKSPVLEYDYNTLQNGNTAQIIKIEVAVPSIYNIPTTVTEDSTSGSNGDGTIKIGGTNVGKYAMAEKLIELVSRATSWANSGVSAVGEYFYHATEAKIYRCKSISTPLTSSNFEEIPFYKGAVYRLNGDIYYWNGTDIELRKDVINVNTFLSQNTAFESKVTARNAVKLASRHYGSFLTYLFTKNGTTRWVFEQFVNGSNLQIDWTSRDECWNEIKNVEFSTNERMSAPEWIKNTDYVVGDLASHEGNTIICTTAHTSAATFGNTEKAKWRYYGNFGNDIITQNESIRVADADKLINLVYIGTDDNVISTLNAGSVYLHTATRTVLRRILTSGANYTYEEIPYYDGAVYTYNGYKLLVRGYKLVCDDVINVNNLINDQTAFVSKQAARNSVKSIFRNFGAIITYKLSDGWYTEQFTGININQWLGDSDWAIPSAKQIETQQEISVPSKLYLLSDVNNDIFYEPILRKWNPYRFDVDIVLTSLSGLVKAIKRVVTLNNPVSNTIRFHVYDDEKEGIILQKQCNLIKGTQGVGSSTIKVGIIGDSYTDGGCFTYALLANGYVPNIQMVGTRSVNNDTYITQKLDGRAGWSLATFMDVRIGADYFNPFYHPSGSHRYWGNTAFWANVCGGTPTGYATRYTHYATLCDATGYPVSPVEGDVIYDSTNNVFKEYQSGSWVQVATTVDAVKELYTWTFDYAKYRSMWNVDKADIFCIYLGINDFKQNFPDADKLATWQERLNSIITSYHTDNPTGKFVILCPNTVYYKSIDKFIPLSVHRNMWTFRKFLIQNYDNRESELIYVVDTAHLIDMENAFGLEKTTPFDGYPNGFTQYDNKEIWADDQHPRINYTTLGYSLAAFIQYHRGS